MTATRKLPAAAELAAMRRDGKKTYREIAAEYGVTAGAVYLAMRRAGLTNRQVCPSCGEGTVHATFQVFVSYPLAGEEVPMPDSDFFVEASCDNEDCPDVLAPEAGDGRLRRSSLTRDYKPVEGEDELEARWVAAVQRIIGEDEEE